MTDVTPARKNLQVEETRFRYAVAESFAQKAAASINFINDFQLSEKNIAINGLYNKVTPPFNDVDGFLFFQYDSTIIDIWMFVQEQTGATSGHTELDLQVATTPGGSFTSIFTTLPRIEYNAGDNIWIHIGSSVTNTTAPVLTSTSIAAGSAIRCVLTGVPVGTFTGKSGCGINIHYRPGST